MINTRDFKRAFEVMKIRMVVACVYSIVNGFGYIETLQWRKICPKKTNILF